jgi:predicted AlkP superfamily pyrophosphatase or phosphodiesterase
MTQNDISAKTLFIGLLFLFIFPLNSFSAPGDGESPKLVLRVVIEQMRYEMLVRYWDQFDEDGGFKRMVNEGMLFTNTTLDYAITQRSAGFASLTTGTYPSVHGVISDYWYNRLADKNIKATEDADYHIVGAPNGADSPSHSPLQLFSTTLGDQLKLLHEESKIYSVSLNPVSATLGNGRKSNGVFWYEDKKGYWVSSSYYMDSLPDWTLEFNQKGLQEIYMNRQWERLLPDTNYTFSMPDDNEAEEGFLLIYQKNFPYNLSVLKNKSRSYKYLKYTPFGNTYTKDFALALIENENLGKDQYPDLLNLSFAASSYVNEIFGARSVEMEDLYLRLDQQLGHLLDYVDEQIGKENVLVVLTSDRGCSDPHEFRTMNNLPARKFNPGQGITLLNSYLNIIYEEGNWIKAYANRQLYLNHGLIDQKGYDIENFQERISRFMVKKSGVLYTVKSNTLNNTNYVSGLFKKVQNSYHPKRSGDILLVLEPGTSEYPKSTGSVYNYDNHIPLIWYGKGIRPGESIEKVSIIDITPTLSHLMGVPIPESSSGRFINSLFDSYRDK